MGDWMSLEAIMRDLSVAQGSCVPASLETYTSNAPPAYNIDEEESEEQKYYTCDADAEASFGAPDCSQIQQMLRLVKESEANKDENLNGSGDFNLLSSEVAKNRNKKKLKKNAALSSIIAAQEADEARKHLIGDNIVQNMFKRKSRVVSEVKDPAPKVPIPAPSLPRPIHKYTPSARAKEYYHKFEEQTKFREQFQEDIWSIVERQMYEIDEKRQEAELASLQESDVTSTSASSSTSGYDIVNLPCHRHEIEADCVVCIVACKHGYNF
ncbi:unnamed protein product [Spodoptera littoralis]|uniref:Uncharacterized protein n=1 Tax=Spodoptera littoralis TaxID=7109 RepID=A0A9P0IED5_SPOLI|nr:unnamed protein product [Spodoptera littoralis]CAH1645281.1 unnamed protein product [Spodoptera littoralis]